MGLTQAKAVSAAPDWLNAALAATPLQSPVSVRPELPGDLDFSALLYALTREAELAAVDWSDAQKRSFCRQQFDAQLTHYRQHYPAAQFLIVKQQSQPVGRLYFEQTAKELRLMEITLLTAARNLGIGGATGRILMHHAHAAGIPMGLHVEPFNPARRLYERLGFREIETRGVYLYMVSEPPDVAVKEPS